jgi:hypothetical protein
MSEVHRSPEYAKFAVARRKELKELIASGQAVCIEKKCYLGRVMMPGQKFDIGHIISIKDWPEGMLVRENTGPSHQYCNRKAGQELSVKPKRDNSKKTQEGNFGKW